MYDNRKLPVTRRSPGPALASTIALFGALGLLGFSAGAQAGTVVAPDCPIVLGSERASRVTDEVINHGDGTWTYEFEVCNTSNPSDGGTFLLRDWELPWDPEALIDLTTIDTPAGWSWSVETRDVINDFTGWEGEISWQEAGDPFFDPDFATQAEVLHFYTSCGDGGYGGDNAALLGGDEDCGLMPQAWLAEGQKLEGFSFTAKAPPVAAPYQASWIEFDPISGDPAFPLGSGGAPLGTGTALTTSFFVTSVPEPSSLLLLGASLGGIGAATLARRRRKRDEDDAAQK